MGEGKFYFVRLCYQASRSALRQNAQNPANTPAFFVQKNEKPYCA